jgi:hypothetical protein
MLQSYQNYGSLKKNVLLWNCINKLCMCTGVHVPDKYACISVQTPAVLAVLRSKRPQSQEVQRSPMVYWHNYLTDALIINFMGMRSLFHKFFKIISNTFEWTYAFVFHLVSDWMQHNTWKKEFLAHSSNKIGELTLMGNDFSWAGRSQASMQKSFNMLQT